MQKEPSAPQIKATIFPIRPYIRMEVSHEDILRMSAKILGFLMLAIFAYLAAAWVASTLNVSSRSNKFAIENVLGCGGLHGLIACHCCLLHDGHYLVACLGDPKQSRFPDVRFGVGP